MKVSDICHHKAFRSDYKTTRVTRKKNHTVITNKVWETTFCERLSCFLKFYYAVSHIILKLFFSAFSLSELGLGYYTYVA